MWFHLSHAVHRKLCNNSGNIKRARACRAAETANFSLASFTGCSTAKPELLSRDFCKCSRISTQNYLYVDIDLSCAACLKYISVQLQLVFATNKTSTMAEKEEPANSLGVIPCILSPDAENHLRWLKTVFAATEKVVHRDEGSKKIVHAALRINGGVIYFYDGTCCSEQVSPLAFSGHYKTAP